VKELQCGDTITIPEGCKAIVKDGSVVFEKEEKEEVQEFKDGDIVILCYFHNDQCGEVMYNTLREMTKGSSVVDMSSLYDGFECIRFYWKDLLKRQ